MYPSPLPRSCSIASLLLLIAALTPTVVFGAGSANSDFRSRSIHPRGDSRKMAAAAVTVAPGYHNGATLHCSDCHVMHASKQHPYDGATATDPFGAYPQQFPGAKNLLKTPDPVDLCLTCHNNQPGIPDVVGADVNGLVERSAGFFDVIGTRNLRGHSLDRGLSTQDWDLCMRCHFGGSLSTASVSCIDCHNPHGNGKARNLQWASWPGGEPEFGLFEATSAAGLQRYEAANVAYGTNAGTVREVTNMCVDCHHIFSGDSYIDPDGDGWHNRHPSSETERLSPNNVAQGDARGTTVSSHWVGGTGGGFLVTPRLRFVNNPALNYVDAMEIDPAKNGVFCLTCHKAHGGENAFALRWNPVSGIGGEGCDQCHAKRGD